MGEINIKDAPIVSSGVVNLVSSGTSWNTGNISVSNGADGINWVYPHPMAPAWQPLQPLPDYGYDPVYGGYRGPGGVETDREWPEHWWKRSAYKIASIARQAGVSEQEVHEYLDEKEVAEKKAAEKEREGMRGLFRVIVVDPATDEIVVDTTLVAKDADGAKMKVIAKAGLDKDFEEYDLIVTRLGDVRAKPAKKVQEVKVVSE